MLVYKQTYDLQFKFLPKLCDLYEDATQVFETFDDNKMINKDFMQDHTEGDYINWNSFKFTKKVVSDNVTEFIYDFGEPMSYPLCRFAIFYVDKSKNINELFTLEKMMLPQRFPYCICGQKGTQHKNYSIQCPGNLVDFEETIKEIIDKGVKPILGIKFNDEE